VRVVGKIRSLVFDERGGKLEVEGHSKTIERDERDIKPVESLTQLKVCTKCGELKETEFFSRDSKSKDGLNWRCKACMNANSKKHYQMHRERCIRNGKSWRFHNPLRSWAQGTIQNHRRRGFLISLSITDLMRIADPALRCAICDCELDWAVEKKIFNDRSPTLDLMDPRVKTAIESNVQIICFQCNSTKRNRTMGEFIEYCRHIVQKFGGHST
jgi:5-methylcytosine-specific restriction endonuclease McrA